MIIIKWLKFGFTYPKLAYSKLSIRTKYFLLAVVFIGSVGIWLPIIIEKIFIGTITPQSIMPNIITYFIAILFAGCIDYFFNQIKKLKVDGIASVFLDLIGLLLFCSILVIVGIFSNVYKHYFISFIIGLVGTIIAYRIWWLANIDNPNFYPKPINALGDDPNNPLSK